MKPSEAIAALIERGLTEAAIAAQVGTTQSTINRIRRGQQPSYDLGKALIELHASGAAPPESTALQQES